MLTLQQPCGSPLFVLVPCRTEQRRAGLLKLIGFHQSRTRNERLDAQWEILRHKFGGSTLENMSLKYMHRAGLTGKINKKNASFWIPYDLGGFPKETYRFAGKLSFVCNVYGDVDKTLAYGPRKIPDKDAPISYEITYRRMTAQDKGAPPGKNPFTFNPFDMKWVNPSLGLERNLDTADLLSTIRIISQNVGLRFELSGIEDRTAGPYFSLTQILPCTLTNWQSAADAIGTIDDMCCLYLQKES